MVKLNVPLQGQAKKYTCWHASAYMIWLYWQKKTGRQGPINTLVNWEKNKPVTIPQFVALAQKVGLKPVAVPNSLNELTLTQLIVKHGPLWSAGKWYGFGHIVVLTGVDRTHVYINDPAGGGKAKKETIAWFNTKLDDHVQGCLMAKDKNRY